MAMGLASSGSAANRLTSNPSATWNDLRSISGSGSGTLASRWANRAGAPTRRDNSARPAASGDLGMETPVRGRRAAGRAPAVVWQGYGHDYTGSTRQRRRPGLAEVGVGRRLRRARPDD